MKNQQYCNNLVKYSRRESREVYIGKIPLGANHPIRIQSMTTVDTLDTHGSVDQILRMVDSGCEYVRLTAPSIKEARNLENIKNELIKKNCNVPLIADIHFTPNAAEVAATVVEKVRINPGNYVDKKKFQNIEYTDIEYLDEIKRIEDKFIPLLELCKKYKTALRIGSNHGSLSDRILSKYGDTPFGMVESALEFIRIAEKEHFHDIVVSMKSSNPIVMIHAYRLLVNKLYNEKLQPYPLHLGVTEAGEAEDGRIKSAIGIGSLLEDGLGDTIRVSLTEDPEKEAPVARMMIDKINQKINHDPIKEIKKHLYSPFEYHRIESKEILNFGGKINVPRVITDFSHVSAIRYDSLKSVGHTYLKEIDKWGMSDLGTDYIYTGDNPVTFMLPNGLKEIINYAQWERLEALQKTNKYPLMRLSDFQIFDQNNKHQVGFLMLDADQDDISNLKKTIRERDDQILMIGSSNKNYMASVRSYIINLKEHSFNNPIVIYNTINSDNLEKNLINLSTDLGTLLVDGIGDGIFIHNSYAGQTNLKYYNEVSFGILQAARTRITKTEYISCPSCGRTLFDLQETTAKIRKKTDHLKGLKIGIMGCIVNGPGEMADADFGYVGSGKDKITLYKGMDVIEKSIPSNQALDKLIDLIKSNGKWIDPPNQSKSKTI